MAHFWMFENENEHRLLVNLDNVTYIRAGFRPGTVDVYLGAGSNYAMHTVVGDLTDLERRLPKG